MDTPVIQNLIYEVRGVKVMVDHELAALYNVTTSALNQAVKRNAKRFPPDFVFQITLEEYAVLMSQIATSSWGGLRKLPHVFSEQGVAMLSGLLNSDVAISANIAIMRAFVAMRHYVTTATTITAELAEIRARLELLERSEGDVGRAIENLYAAIAALSAKSPQPDQPRAPIGYRTAGNGGE